MLLGFTKHFLFVEVFCYVELFSTTLSGDLFQKPTAEYEALVTGRFFFAVDKVGCEMDCEMEIFCVATKKSNLN